MAANTMYQSPIRRYLIAAFALYHMKAYGIAVLWDIVLYGLAGLRTVRGTQSRFKTFSIYYSRCKFSRFDRVRSERLCTYSNIRIRVCDVLSERRSE
jgi:hypothetical protein